MTPPPCRRNRPFDPSCQRRTAVTSRYSDSQWSPVRVAVRWSRNAVSSSAVRSGASAMRAYVVTIGP